MAERDSLLLISELIREFCPSEEYFIAASPETDGLI
jgi:hypothetical protein